MTKIELFHSLNFRETCFGDIEECKAVWANGQYKSVLTLNEVVVPAGQKINEILEQVWETTQNIESRGWKAGERSTAVGDILLTTTDGRVTAYLVVGLGFKVIELGL